jgi:hypothetical protein
MNDKWLRNTGQTPKGYRIICARCKHDHLPNEQCFVLVSAGQNPDADYVCNGTNDAMQIQAAIRTAGPGGLIKFTGGAFYLSINNLSIRGNSDAE